MCCYRHLSVYFFCGLQDVVTEDVCSIAASLGSLDNQGVKSKFFHFKFERLFSGLNWCFPACEGFYTFLTLKNTAIAKKSHVCVTKRTREVTQATHLHARLSKYGETLTCLTSYARRTKFRSGETANFEALKVACEKRQIEEMLYVQDKLLLLWQNFTDTLSKYLWSW